MIPARSRLRRLLPSLPPTPADFSTALRSQAVTARVGLWLGICFGVAFLTGLWSHWGQDIPGWLAWPTSPSWGYRVTQGLHVTAGSAAVPLLLVKLWSVYPRLFQMVPRRPPGTVLVHVLERGSIGLLVASALFQLVTGLMNSSQWYPWAFGFRDAHYAVGWLAIGSVLVHVAVKLPVIRRSLTGPVELDDGPRVPAESEPEQAGDAQAGDDPQDAGVGGTEPAGTEPAGTEPAGTEPAGTEPADTKPAPEPVGRVAAGLSRRTLLRTTWAAAGVAAVTTAAGGTVPWLRQLSIFGVRSGDGPQGVPINRSAERAGVLPAALAPDFRLTVVNGDRSVELTRADLEALPQHTASLPIACVEGWSASGVWTGVRVVDLLALVGAPASDLAVSSLQTRYAFGTSELPANVCADPDTLLALRLHGEPLHIDHGFPCRIIAPNRPGVLQTKWVSRIEVAT